ncbi:MAG: hypothetical protein ACTSQP_14235 [Promethearchaeota archaeon]
MLKDKKDLLKTVLCFYLQILPDNNIKIEKLTYDPALYDYFLLNNIDFKKELEKILIESNFNRNLTRNQLKNLINKLNFNKKIIFDYLNKTIKYDHQELKISYDS